MKTIFIVTCNDQDNLRQILGAFSTQELADAFVAHFEEIHKDDSFWRLDDIVIELCALDEPGY